jgi:hypothetical protein
LVPYSNESASAFRTSVGAVSFMSIFGAGTFEPSRPIWFTLASAMCRICSPHVRCAGVGLKPNFSPGMAAAIFISVSRCEFQSLSAPSLIDTA